MNKFSVRVVLFSLIIFIPFISVSALSIDLTESAKSAYKQIQYLSAPNIIVPTVVQLPLENIEIERGQFGVYDTVRQTFIPYQYTNSSFENLIPISIVTNAVSTSQAFNRHMVDNKVDTYTEFALPVGDAPGNVTLTLSASQPITASKINLTLDAHVALPTSVRITTGVEKKTVLATVRPRSRTIAFPETTSSSWDITLTYSQPLRIAELQLTQLNAARTDSEYIRFLAQPNTSYEIYINPDRNGARTSGESGNLSSNIDVLMLSSLSTVSNPRYVQADIDEDGIPDTRDNCIQTKNPDQADINNNGRGDLCDDFDKDGRINSVDNCINLPNSNQRDEDGDGVGDACDEEESRITEKYKWIPWAGIGIAIVVIIALFARTVHEMRKTEDTEKTPDNEQKDT